jgi:hypothetical protein
MMSRLITTVGCVLTLSGLGCDSPDAGPSAPPADSPGAAGSTAPHAGGEAKSDPAPPSQQPSASDTPASPGTPPSSMPAGSAQPGSSPAGGAPPSSKPVDVANVTPTRLMPGVDPSAIDWHGDIRGLCGIASGFPDDKACIPAPPPSQGIQLHVGPKDYNDPADVARFVLKPGEETSQCWTLKTPNDKPFHYQTSTLSGRAGTHHIIDGLYTGTLQEGGFAPCVDGSGRDMDSDIEQVGSIPGASKPFMRRGTVPPEYAHVGRLLPAATWVQADMHYYNFTDREILREFWLNLYYADESQITQTGDQIAALGGFGWNRTPIEPGTDKVYTYSCPVKGDGFIMSLLGHYHSHGKRFSAYLTRAGSSEPQKVFEMFDYMEPAQFEYNSVIANPMFADGMAGALSGQLAVHDGDTLTWECHIVNDSDLALKYVNEVKTGEMCNLWGSSVGNMPISCFMQ